MGVKMNEIKVVSAFPASGKTYFYNTHQSTCCDSDSSKFPSSDPNWIIDYVDDIEKKITQEQNKVIDVNGFVTTIYATYGLNCIFVSSHKEVRQELDERGIEYMLVYPSPKMYKEICSRLLSRAIDEKDSSEGLYQQSHILNAVVQHYYEWIADMVKDSGKHNFIELQPGEYISDYFGLQEKKLNFGTEKCFTID